MHVGIDVWGWTCMWRHEPDARSHPSSSDSSSQDPLIQLTSNPAEWLAWVASLLCESHVFLLRVKLQAVSHSPILARPLWSWVMVLNFCGKNFNHRATSSGPALWLLDYIWMTGLAECSCTQVCVCVIFLLSERICPHLQCGFMLFEVIRG